MPRSPVSPRRRCLAALALALATTGRSGTAAAAAPPALLPEGTGVEASFQLGAPQTFALGIGMRTPRYGVSWAYQPPGDDTFLASSWAAAARVYADPLDSMALFQALSQVYLGVAAGQYDYSQKRSGGGVYTDPAAPAPAYPYTFSTQTEVKGAFVAPHVGLSLFNAKGQHLDTEIGWFKPLSRRRQVSSQCVGDPSGAQANCAAGFGTLGDPTPPWIRKSGLYVTALRYVWRLN